MRRLFIAYALLATLLALAPPAPAAAQGGALPPLRLITAARFEHAFTEDGRVVFVGRGYKESRERIYIAFQRVGGGFAEVVLYDGAAYSRVGDEREWRSVRPEAVRELVPTADLLLLFDGPLSSLGPAQIGGVATEHYQIWGDGGVSDPARPGFVKVDFFVGAQDRYLHQLQISRTRAAEGGTVQSGLIVRYFDHDDPALVVRPPR